MAFESLVHCRDLTPCAYLVYVQNNQHKNKSLLSLLLALLQAKILRKFPPCLPANLLAGFSFLKSTSYSL